MKKILLISLVFLTGCYENFYESHYVPHKLEYTVDALERKERKAKTWKEPVLIRGGRYDQVNEMLEEEDYEMLGYSGFQGYNVPNADLKDFARSIGAHKVTYENKFLGTETKYFPLVNYSTGNVVNIPRTITYYDYFAIYWRKEDNMKFEGWEDVVRVK